MTTSPFSLVRPSQMIDWDEEEQCDMEERSALAEDHAEEYDLMEEEDEEEDEYDDDDDSENSEATLLINIETQAEAELVKLTYQRLSAPDSPYIFISATPPVHTSPLQVRTNRNHQTVTFNQWVEMLDNVGIDLHQGQLLKTNEEERDSNEQVACKNAINLAAAEEEDEDEEYDSDYDSEDSDSCDSESMMTFCGDCPILDEAIVIRLPESEVESWERCYSWLNLQEEDRYDYETTVEDVEVLMNETGIACPDTLTVFYDDDDDDYEEDI